MESQLLPGLTKRPNLIFNLVDVGSGLRFLGVRLLVFLVVTMWTS